MIQDTIYRCCLRIKTPLKRSISISAVYNRITVQITAISTRHIVISAVALITLSIRRLEITSAECRVISITVQLTVYT
jgi:hypothetical protein